jgi:Xaa-Pro aminopeptidase
MRPERSALRSLLAANRVDALLVTKRENVRYITGFTGSTGFLLLTPSGGYFITDSRYATQSEREVAGYRVEIIRSGEQLIDRVARLVKKRDVGRLGYEPGDLTVGLYQRLKRGLAPTRLHGVSKKGVETLRIVKQEGEIEALTEAVRRAEQAFRAIRRKLKPGAEERSIAVAMEQVMRRRGAARAAFDLIVASGERGALPHGIAAGRRMKQGDLVVVDFGAECDGYYSDMTRTVYLGKRLTGVKRKIYETVQRAQEAAMARVRPGVAFREIDMAARDTIREAGFGDYFGHGTGHGIGLEVHEPPYVGPNSEETVRQGMVFTVEPGIYIPGVGGVRIEDMVFVTADGCRPLTTLPRVWQV